MKTVGGLDIGTAKGGIRIGICGNESEGVGPSRLVRVWFSTPEVTGSV